MKINKFDFLKLVGKHLSRKFGSPSADLVMLATSLMPMFNAHTPKMMLAGILDEDNRINVEVLEQKLIELFNITPLFNVPLGTNKVTITKRDIELFLEDLKKYAEVEQIIYLSCNK